MRAPNDEQRQAYADKLARRRRWIKEGPMSWFFWSLVWACVGFAVVVFTAAGNSAPSAPSGGYVGVFRAALPVVICVSGLMGVATPLAMSFYRRRLRPEPPA